MANAGYGTVTADLMTYSTPNEARDSRTLFGQYGLLNAELESELKRRPGVLVKPSMAEADNHFRRNSFLYVVIDSDNSDNWYCLPYDEAQAKGFLLWLDAMVTSPAEMEPTVPIPANPALAPQPSGTASTTGTTTASNGKGVPDDALGGLLALRSMLTKQLEGHTSGLIPSPVMDTLMGHQGFKPSGAKVVDTPIDKAQAQALGELDLASQALNLVNLVISKLAV